MPGSDGTLKSYWSLTSGMNLKVAFPAPLVGAARLMPKPLIEAEAEGVSGVPGVRSDRFVVAVTLPCRSVVRRRPSESGASAWRPFALNVVFVSGAGPMFTGTSTCFGSLSASTALKVTGLEPVGSGPFGLKLPVYTKVPLAAGSVTVPLSGATATL